MCGIAGFLGDVPGAAAETVLRQMASGIAHRGPDDEGLWLEPSDRIALAHRRLSIVDLSPAGHQPMHSSCGRYVIVFNGEIYNHLDLRAELDRLGPRSWRGHSDTEVLLAAIAEWGVEAALQRSVGMFALGLWDRQTKTLILARDRIGEKPLYYFQNGKMLAFASELKALQQHPACDREVDRNSLTLFMRHGYIPAPYTIFKGVHKLQPGAILVVGPEFRSTTRRYWTAMSAADAAQRAPFVGDANDAVDVLERLLQQSLRGQMMADVPLGAFLSGGIDSSTIVALMQSLNDRPTRTFTIGFHVPGYNEAEHAKSIAQHLGTDHTELYVTEQEALQVIPRLPAIYSEPFADSSQIPTFLVSELASKSVKVSLSGDAGDELFSGYTRYSATQSLWQGVSSAPPAFRSILARGATAVAPATYDRIGGAVMKALPSRLRRGQIGDKIHKAAGLLAMNSIDEVYLRLCSHWQKPSQVVIGGAEYPTMLTGFGRIPEWLGPVERMMHLDLVSYLPDDILVKVDRAAMAVGLETRVPLLDHRIVEFAMSLPLSISRADHQTKWPLRKILSKYVPTTLTDRPKMGFGVPIDSWLRGALRDWAEDLMSESRLRREGFFNPEPVRDMWADHLTGRRNHQYLLWNVLMFQAWAAASAVASPSA